ncbi:MAG: conserved rane protein [Microbacteriaceae bacterium]|jgi:hypothetical protein|nr:conserved rane protein [Microbacteriaceae bacterium]
MTLVPGKTPAQVEKGIEKLLSVQRPIVLAEVRGIRRRHPDATPTQVITILERHYLAAVTTGGAAVGASAVIPGVGIGISLALSGVETAGFLEASALFAQSVTEVHGIAVEDPERARTLVMTMMLGSAGSDLVKQLAGQAAGVGPTRGRFWGELVTKSLPQAAMGQIGDRIRRAFVKRFAVTQGASVIGRAIPFGIGAVIGGTGNHMLGRKVVASSRQAFGPAPESFPLVLESAIRPVTVRTARARIAMPRFIRKGQRG